MARLENREEDCCSSRPIPASTQLLAVAWLRWRIFINNSFRRRPDSSGKILGLVALILLRILVWSFLAAMAIGPAIACGMLAWGAIAHNHPEMLISLLTGVAVFWQFIALNGISVAATLSSFNPSSLTRFPIPFGRYLILRMLFGFLAPSTIAGCLALLAATIGIGIADSSLALPAVIVLLTYGLVNIFFTRMLEAWFERWMASRRFREIFGVFWVLFFVGIQFLNTQHAAAHSHEALPLSFLHRASLYLHWLPPGFAANAVLFHGHPLTAIGQFVVLAGYAVLFLGIYAVRIHKQFLGEYLSEDSGSPRTSNKNAGRQALRAQTSTGEPAQSSRTFFPPVVAACLRKEWLFFRGNTRQIVGLLAALFFVLILHKQFFPQHSEYFLPGALGYVLLGILPSAYNIFGVDGAGVQFYLFAPIRLREVILAKNLMTLILMLIEVTLAWSIVLGVSKAPIPLYAQVSAALWLVFVIGVNLILGTLRSIQAPRRFIPGQTQQVRGASMNGSSQILMMATFFGSILLQFPVIFLGTYFHQPWLGAFVFTILAAAAVGGYLLMLHHAESLILQYRDRFAEELCKV